MGTMVVYLHLQPPAIWHSPALKQHLVCAVVPISLKEARYILTQGFRSVARDHLVLCLGVRGVSGRDVHMGEQSCSLHGFQEAENERKTRGHTLDDLISLQ